MINTNNYKINTFENIDNNIYIDEYNQNNNQLTEEIEKLKEKLLKYNTENDTNLLFIDLLKNISIELTAKEKYQIKKDGNLLISKLNEELDKMLYGDIEDISNSEIDKLVELNNKIIKLRSKLEITFNRFEKNHIEFEIFKLETQRSQISLSF